MVTISDYYENIMKAQNRLSEILENDETDRTDLEWEQWVGDTIRMLSKQFGISEIELDEFYQFM
jgi:hypothetical protein